MNYFNSTQLVKSYFERLRKNRITFLKGKENRKVRKRLRENLGKLQDVLKEKTYPKRETEQLKLAQKIWAALMVSALKHISLAKHVRGFNDILEYYHKSVKFEDLLFGIEPTYRDHTMHTLWVYLLGDHILNNNSCISNAKKDWGIIVQDTGADEGTDESKQRIKRHTDELNKYRQKIENELIKYEDTVYCIAALCHDLAYPFEKAEKVNKRVEELSKDMGLQSFERLQYNFSIEQSLLINELIELTSLKALIVGSNNVEFIKDNPTFVDMSQSFEQRKHGILSSYLLYRLVDTTGEVTHTKIHALQNRHEFTKHIIIRKAIFYAISSHTCAYAYSVNYNNYRFLLSLFDELEEFSRFVRLGRGGVDEICQSGFECEDDGIFSIEYCFDKKHIADPKQFFFARAKRICRMVEVEKSEAEGIKQGGTKHSIKKITMTCIDKKTVRDPEHPHHYRLRIDDEGVFCMIPGKGHKWNKITPDPETRLQEWSRGTSRKSR